MAVAGLKLPSTGRFVLRSIGASVSAGFIFATGFRSNRANADDHAGIAVNPKLEIIEVTSANTAGPGMVFR
jgi:hypothetical protein